MSPRVGGYTYAWDPQKRQIKIKYKRAGAPGTTPIFGLGNATFRFNFQHPPDHTVTRPITGETGCAGLLPTALYPLKRWSVAAITTKRENITLHGANGWSAKLSFHEATTFALREVQSVPIKPLGYGRRYLAPRGSGSGVEDSIGWDVRGGNYTQISVGAMDLQAERLVWMREHLYALRDGVLGAYRYDGSKESGFVADEAIVQTIQAKIDATSWISPQAKIVEIAGREQLKIRYDTGDAVVVTHPSVGIFEVEHLGSNVARISAHDSYRFDERGGKYYKSGAGSGALVGLLYNDAYDDIVSIFEGVDGDRLVRLSQTEGIDAPIVGFVGEHPVYAAEGGFVAAGHRVENFGEIVLRSERNPTLRLHAHVASDAPVDYSDRFAPAHYGYIQAHREDWVQGWSGYGATGHVVGGLKTMHTKVDYPYTDALTHSETIPFVVIDGTPQAIDAEGNLSPIELLDLEGAQLVEYILSHDLSHTLVAHGAIPRAIEPFSAHGFCFGYGDDHTRIVDPNALATLS